MSMPSNGIGPCLNNLLLPGELSFIHQSFHEKGSGFYYKIKLMHPIAHGERGEGAKGKLQSILLAVDQFKNNLKVFNVPIDIHIQEIDASYADISEGLFSVLNPDSPIFSDITKLDLSHTNIKTSDLNRLHLLKNLKHLKLENCQELSLFEKPEETPCGSVDAISLIGSRLTADPDWLTNIGKKFPNVSSIDFCQMDGGRICGLNDTILFEDIRFPQVYSPCGHVASIETRITDMTKQQCYRCQQAIQQAFDVKMQRSRLEKISDRWVLNLLDYRGHHIIQDDNAKLDASKRRDYIYFHSKCREVFTAMAVSEIITEWGGKIDSNSSIIDLGKTILCPACPGKEPFNVIRVYPEIVADTDKKHFKSLEEVQHHRFTEKS